MDALLTSLVGYRRSRTPKKWPEIPISAEFLKLYQCLLLSAKNLASFPRSLVVLGGVSFLLKRYLRFRAVSKGQCGVLAWICDEFNSIRASFPSKIRTLLLLAAFAASAQVMLTFFKEFCFQLAMLGSKIIAGYHSYSIKNLENLPRGKALVVAYHSPGPPQDVGLFVYEVFQRTSRRVRSLGADFIFATPVFGTLARVVGGLPARASHGLACLQNNEAVVVCPGGVFEAFTGTAGDYSLNWGQRKGFAELASASGAPIVPMFTQNVGHLHWFPCARTRLARAVFERTGLPIFSALPSLPYLPVKLTTFLGEPIPTKGVAVEVIARRTREAIRELMRKHQHVRVR